MKKSKEMFKKQLLCCAGCIGFGALDIWLSRILNSLPLGSGLYGWIYLLIIGSVIATFASILGNTIFYIRAIKAMINGD